MLVKGPKVAAVAIMAWCKSAHIVSIMLIKTVNVWYHYYIAVSKIIQTQNESGIYHKHHLWFLLSRVTLNYIRVSFSFFFKVAAWRRHQMETFSALLALCSGNSLFSLIWAWTNGSVNSREAGDLRRHCAHCNVTSYGTDLVEWYLVSNHLDLD